MEDHIYDRIQKHLAAGGNVLLATYLKATLFQPKHADFFRKPKNEGESGVYIRRGKCWDYCYPEYIKLVPGAK